jgi:hypothetical protein
MIFVPSAGYIDMVDVRSDRNASPKSCGTLDEVSSGYLLPRTDVLRRLDRVVHVIETERHADRQHEPDRHGHQPRAASGHRHGSLRHLGAIHDSDVVLAAVARNAKFFLPLQERFVDLTVALGLALHDVVAHALPTEILSVGFRGLEVLRERPFFEYGRFVLVLDRLQRPVDVDVELALRVLNLDQVGQHGGVLGSVLVFEAALLAQQLGLPALERLDLRVHGDGGNRVWAGAARHRLDLTVQRFLLDP